MYISKIEISNYRVFGKSKFQLNLKPFTLIIGENNAGKSTILKAIELMLSQDIGIYRSRMLELDDFNFKSRDEFLRKVNDNSVNIEEVNFPDVLISLIFEDFNDAQEAIVGDWFIGSDLKKAKITYKFKVRSGFNKEEWIKNVRNKEYENHLKIEFPIKEYDYIIYGGNNETNKCESYLLSLLKMDYLDALRDAKKELTSSSSSNLLFRVLDSMEDSNYDDISTALMKIDGSINKNAALKKIKEDIIKLLDNVSLDYNKENDVEFNFNSLEIKEMLKKISLRYGNNPIDISKNGLGRNNLLYISLLLSRFSNTNYFGKETNFRIVGIEEPESHLHVHSQYHLAKNIKELVDKEDEIQLIMTSHSTHICGTLDIENTVIIYKDDDEIKNHYILDGFSNRSEDKKIKRYLQKYLDATKTPMFFSRKLILVEGIAEQILIPTFFKLYTGKTLESIGCSLLNVNGIAFKNFLEVIKRGYYIKCAVLTDGDLGTNTERRAENLIECYSEYNKVISIKKNIKTFETEIMEYNKKDNNKRHILNAYMWTRPIIGKEYNDLFYDNKILNVKKEIDINEVFGNIEEYKADFAYNLNMSIEDYNKEFKFKIPQYIKDAFDFIK